MKHLEPHPLAGESVTLERHPDAPPDDIDTVECIIEDWADRLGLDWMTAGGNPAAIKYAMRSAFAPIGVASIPTDSEVIYCKVGPFGHLLHADEIAHAARGRDAA